MESKPKQNTDAVKKNDDLYRKTLAVLAHVLRLHKNIVVEVDRVRIENPVEEVTVKNQPDISGIERGLQSVERAVKANKIKAAPSTVSIKSNDLKKSVSLLSGIMVTLDKLVKSFPKREKVVIDGGVKITNRDAKDAIPVVLTTADRKAFYNAISEALAGFVRGAGGGSGTNDPATGSKQDEIINAIEGNDYDQVTVTYPDTETEVYTYTLGVDTVRVVTVVYTDSTKANLLTITKS